MSTRELFEFQSNTIDRLIEITSIDRRSTVVVKAPTGAGKTVILINFIDRYLSHIQPKTAFIWLCPGKGNLEEQSKAQMTEWFPQRNSMDLLTALNSGFTSESITFVNWELVTNKNNNALKDGERKNLYERIDEAKRNNIQFIIIIDEEHSNNTSKANDLINSFTAKNVIRVSATAKNNKVDEFIKIDDNDVIESGLITKALYVNEGLTENVEIDEDYNLLIDLAEQKRKEILERYRKTVPNRVINPLVLIQFPNGHKETIDAVESKLANLGYTTDNGLVSVWMSEDKRDLPPNLTDNNATPCYLLMKQAISTGWDCPRAKILIKLREGGSEDFQIQTIGRIRRMPERRHYDDQLLDYCFVYTLDEKYKSGLLESLEARAFELRRLFLKDKCKSFRLVKESRDLDHKGIGEREILKLVYDYFINFYKLGDDREENKRILSLSENGFVFGQYMYKSAVHGMFKSQESLTEDDLIDRIKIKWKVNTHNHGIFYLHSLDSIKKSIGISNHQVKTILERLFRSKIRSSLKKLLSLNTLEFYAFVINNEEQLKAVFRNVSSHVDNNQHSLYFQPKESDFKILEQDNFTIDLTSKETAVIESNSYKNYTRAFITDRLRSKSERMFEMFCEQNDQIDWYYKNGDKGKEYFSIVYTNGLNVQRLFYPDYILKKTDGSIWLIETKGGELNGQDQNIDIQIENKFSALNKYAMRHDGINWGFVRNKNENLYINNTEYSSDMNDRNWKALSSVI